MDPKEKRLLEGFIAGDENIRNEFIDKYSNLIKKAIYNTFFYLAIQCNSEDAKDLYQETFRTIIKNDCAKLRMFRGECRLSTWIYKITKHLVIDYIKKTSLERKFTISLQDKIGEDKEDERSEITIDKRASVIENIEENEKIDLCEKYLKQLDYEDRAILEMYYLKDFSLKQIAKILGKSEDAVFMQKKRIIEKLTKKYKKDVGF